MKRWFNKILVNYYKWRCASYAKSVGIVSYHFLSKRMMDDPLHWNGHNWQEWREMNQFMRRDRSKDVTVSSKDLDL